MTMATKKVSLYSHLPTRKSVAKKAAQKNPRKTAAKKATAIHFHPYAGKKAFKVMNGEKVIASFAELSLAKEYAQALADKTGKPIGIAK